MSNLHKLNNNNKFNGDDETFSRFLKTKTNYMQLAMTMKITINKRKGKDYAHKEEESIKV